MYIALSSFLGLILCLFWNDINCYCSMHQREGWKPCGNENCFNETYPIQQASYWRIGSRLCYHGDNSQHLTRTKDQPLQF
ncbi:hypothetical protein SLA2020_027540 [Shorea laevis]